jgi:hypothetical protein
LTSASIALEPARLEFRQPYSLFARGVKVYALLPVSGLFLSASPSARADYCHQFHLFNETE